MNTSNTIQDALEMITNHDWYWRMADCGYEANYNAAKAHMQAFLRLVNTIANDGIREALKNLWLLKFDEARDAVNGRNDEQNKAKQVEIRNFLAQAA